MDDISTSFAPPASFTALIECWGNMRDFSNETKQPYERVKRWKWLNNIRPKYWPEVKAAAWRRGWFWVDDAFLAKLAAAGEREPEPQSSQAGAA